MLLQKEHESNCQTYSLGIPVRIYKTINNAVFNNTGHEHPNWTTLMKEAYMNHF